MSFSSAARVSTVLVDRPMEKEGSGWSEHEAADLISATFRRVNAAMPPGYELVHDHEPWATIDSAIDAAVEAQDMDALKVALVDYEVKAVQAFNRFLDPRPDIPEDTDRWVLLLRWAAEMDSTLAANLRTLRGYGLRTMWTNTGWTLQPDPAGRWDKGADYQELRQRMLMPHRERVVALLKRLTDEKPLQRVV